MPIIKLLSIVAFMLNCSILLVSQDLQRDVTRDIIKYNFESKNFDTIAGVSFDIKMTSDRTNFDLGEMYPSSVPMDMPTENLSEGTQFTSPLVAKDQYSMVNYPVSTTIKLFKVSGNDLRDQCTGTMVGPRHVLTSAHCVLKPYTVEVVVEDLIAVAGYDVSMDTTDHIKAQVSDVYFLDEWNIGEGDDQALLELDEPIGYYTGWVSFGYNDDDEYFSGKNFHKFSYPTYRTPYNQYPFNGDTLYYSYGAIDYVADDFLGVIGHIKGAGGESGSSILYINNEDIYTSYGVLTWVGYYNHSRFNAERFNAFQHIVREAVLTNTSELLEDSEVVVYPNPSNDYINIEVNAADVDINSIGIFDISGRLIQVINTDYDRTRIDVAELPEGLYHLKMISKKGLVATKSFVKSK